MEKYTDEFQRTIAAMLEQEAATDPLFAESLKKENKTMDKCCDYIIQQVKKSDRAGFADSEILGMAKHYWDEDVEAEPHGQCRVVVNHTVELSEEEKKKAKDEAMRQLIDQEKKRMQERPKKVKPQAETAQPSLFDL